MQPVQDLTVEDRVSRTQYQYSLEDAGRARAGARGRRGSSTSCARCRSCATWPATSRTRGCRRTLAHRPRHGLAARRHAADDRRHALRRLRAAADLDHVHAAQPVPRRARGRSRSSAGTRRRSTTSTCAAPAAAAVTVPLSAFDRASSETTRAAGDQPQGQFPAVDAVVQSGARARRWARRCEAIETATARARAAGEHPGAASRARPGVPGLAGQRAAADPGGARHGLHRAGRALRELHPSDHDPLHAAVGRRGRAARAAALPAPTSSVIALIGIILLIGIVKKNAIMMIDFALEAERDERQVAARRDLRPACCASGRS